MGSKLKKRMAYQQQQQYGQQNNSPFGQQQNNSPFGQQQQQYNNNNNNERQSGFRCSICYQPFIADPNTKEIKYKTVNGNLLHFECFKCSACQNLIQGKFNVKDDGSYLCINCIGQQYGQDTHIVAIDKNNPILCVVCNKVLSKNWIEGAKGEKFHNYCFKCMDCGSPLSKEPEYCEFEGKNYCKPCRVKQMT